MPCTMHTCMKCKAVGQLVIAARWWAATRACPGPMNVFLWFFSGDIRNAGALLGATCVHHDPHLTMCLARTPSD